MLEVLIKIKKICFFPKISYLCIPVRCFFSGRDFSPSSLKRLKEVQASTDNESRALIPYFF